MLPSYIARIQKNVIFKDKIFYKKNFISSTKLTKLILLSKTKNYNNFSINGLSPSREYSKTYASTGFGTRGTLVVPNSQKINVKENKKYNFQKRLYTSYSKFTEVKLVTIGIASPLRILQWAEKTLPNGKIYGEVLNANTLHHKTFKPQKGGLFCERIFGPLKDFECSCGKIDKTAKYSLRETEQKPDGPARNNKNLLEETIQDNNKNKNKPKKSLGELSFGIPKDKSKTTRKLRKFCPDCDVEYTWSVIRRYQLGYIKLISPVTHVWFLKGTPSYLSILLDIKKRFLQSITYCSETLTIEHSGSAATALQSYKISGGALTGVDLDSPSKIYASWSKAKSMATSSNENSDMNAAGSNSEKIISYSENNNNPVYSANPPSINSNGRFHGALKKDNILDYRTKRINTINKWKNTIKMSDGQNNKVVLSLGKNQGFFPTKNSELPKFDSRNKDREFSINKTSQLLTFFQRPIKEKNIKTLNYRRLKSSRIIEENSERIFFDNSRRLKSSIIREFSKKDSDLLDGSSSVSAEFIPTHLFRTSKLKTDISKLLSSRLLKQPYLDLYSLNNGKYPIKNNNVYSSYMNLPITFASEKDNLITKTEYKKNKQIKENYSMKELSKNSPINNNRSRVLETPPALKKRLYNNVYTLSHRERWGSRVNEGKDWQIFLLYNTAVSNSKDQPIFAYKERISLTAFNSQIYRSYKNSTKDNLQSKFSSSQLQNSELITPREGSIARSPIRPDENRESARSVYQNKQPYGVLINNSFFSGPGIIQQLLSELTFSEMKKLDKQNRLLLYVLNKSIFKLKKHVKIFIYDKASQIEMRELCKKRDLLIRRTKLVRKLFRKDSDPSSMILTVLPVLPPDLRPIVKMGGQIAASDLNRFYQRVIYRNDRLKKFLKDPATSNSYEMKYAQRLLQEAVDNLIQNSQSSGEKDSRGRALKSLSDILKGKQGRFRQFLLGKRVDYSGRSVIVVGPKLKLYQCGIPVEMALELYLPFLLKIILNKNYAKTVVGAKALIKNNRPLALELLREIMQVSPVLLNRAPTLHRLGFQAFVPKLVEGRAILLHPLVCSSFNADFDGDQMAVHVPITIEARAEAWKLMLSRNNLLSPATGDPLSIPSQDMVLGCYYLTTNSNKATLSLLRGSGFFFTDLQKVLYQYDLQQIDLHALVWVKWSGLIENGNDQEEPLEIRLSTTGHWQELSYNYIRHFDSSSQLIHQYMSTTPGRILFYSLLQSI